MRRLLLVFVIVCSVLFPISSAQAAWLQYQSSPADNYNSQELLPEYDITGVNLAVSDTNPDEYWFFILFAKPVTSTLFADGLKSWAGVFLDTNDDGKLDYSIETDAQPYSGNYYKSATFSDRTTGSPISSSRCTAKTWTNLNTSATWIGFSIQKNCLTFNATIGIQAYADHIASDDKQYDYAPEQMWRVNLSGGTVTENGSNSSKVTVGQLPSMNLNGSSTINSPSAAPEDLVALAADVTKSVVTVKCGQGVGSGWAIQVDLSSSNRSDGFNSYVITNHHVIADCINRRDITLLLADQREVSAYVYSWDESNDVAGILTKTNIPALNWRGATPQQGWWVGAIGSPLGFPGILTTGIVSSVNSQTTRGTTNAAINPGNSGGPVFDRTGRVIGLATAKYVNSEGFGIFHGTPLLCKNIVVCTSTSQVWGVSSPNTSPSPKPSPSASSAAVKKPQYIQLSRKITDTSVSVKYISVRATANSGLPVSALSDDLSVCSYENDKLFLYSPGSCTIYFDQDGNDVWSAAIPLVLNFEVLKKSNSESTVAKVTEASHTWAGYITSYEWISGSNPLKNNKLTTLKISGACTKNGKTIQGWKNTDSKGKRYPNGSRQTGKAWKCVDGYFEGNVQISGGTRFYIVELPKSHVGTTIEFRVNQELEFIEYIGDAAPDTTADDYVSDVFSPIAVTDLTVLSSGGRHSFTFTIPPKNPALSTYELGYAILKREGLDPSFDLDYPLFTSFRTLTNDKFTLTNAEILELFRKNGASYSNRSIMFKVRTNWGGSVSTWGNGAYILPSAISTN